MKINQDLILRNNNRNLEGEIVFPNCRWFQEQAENILMMLEKIPPIQYNSTEEFRQRLIVEYWAYYDNLDSVFTQYPQLHRRFVFQNWFMKATNPEHIRRAAQWLVEHQYIILKQTVREKSLGLAEGMRETARARREN